MPRSRVGVFRNERTRSTPLYSKHMFWCVLYYLGAFGSVWMPYKTRFKMSRSGEKVCAMKSFRNFSQRSIRSTPLDPNLMFRGLSYYLGAFGTVCWLQHSVQNGPNWCKSSCHEVASEFFVGIAPDPPHWTLNSCFGVFCTIWMHLGPFDCLTKLSAKQAELVQKFVPQSRILFFRNKQT